jgi:hypothetical protein
MKKKVFKTELVEVLIPANSVSINYPIGSQYTNLQGGKVVGIEVIPVGTCSVSPKGVNVVNDTVLKKAYLETFDGGKLLLNKMPLNRLTVNPGSPQIAPELEPFKIDLSSSKIVLGNNVGIAATDEAFVLIFHYE